MTNSVALRVSGVLSFIASEKPRRIRKSPNGLRWRIVLSLFRFLPTGMAAKPRSNCSLALAFLKEHWGAELEV